MEISSKESIALVAAIGTLAGATIAAFITKVMELFLEKRKHTYSLQKEYFVSKIKIAEKATVQLIQLSNALTGFGIIFTNLENEGEYVAEYNEKAMEAFQRILAQAEQSYDAMAIHAYFDLSDTIKYSFSFSRTIQEKLNELQLVANESKELQNDPTLSNAEFNKELEIRQNRGRELIIEFKNIFDKMSDMCLQTINEIRESLQKHHV